MPSASATSWDPVRRKWFEKNGQPTLTESALYSPLDEPEVFAGFCFALIIALSKVLRLDRFDLALLSRLRLNQSSVVGAIGNSPERRAASGTSFLTVPPKSL